MLGIKNVINHQICDLNYPREETTAPQTGSLFLPRTSRKLIEGVVSDRTVVLRKQPCRDLLASRVSPVNDRLAVLAVRPLLGVLSMVLVKYNRMAVSLGLLLGGHDSSPPRIKVSSLAT